MRKNDYWVIGVMSGTSLDGIDLAFIHFSLSEKRQWQFELLRCETAPYPAYWKGILQAAIDKSATELDEIDADYTIYLASVISGFIAKHKIKNLDAVCSHGHTILHQPHQGITLQIGNLPNLAKLLGQTVVCDFRVQDVLLGGQGAPLVPVGDRLLFGQYDYCLNLGGFANCSFEKLGFRLAYDICPANIVLNHYAEKMGHSFDAGGNLGASGLLNTPLLVALNALPFYKDPAPKSLGLEWVQKYIFPLLDAFEQKNENILRTFTEHIAMQLAAQFSENASVLITGGGVYNSYLISRLQYYKKIDSIIPPSELIEYKEALIFGLLGVLKLREEVNCLSSVTGASNDHSSGKIYLR